MKRTLTVIISLVFLAPLVLRAQLDPVSLALRAYQDKELNKARELIDAASNNAVYKGLSKTWYFKAYIYKDLYKADRTSADAGALRDTAIASYFNTISLDQSNEFVEDSKQSIRYLSSTIYNDAATALDTNNFSIAQELYQSYKTTSLKLNPDMDFRARDIEFYLYVASKYSSIYETFNTIEKPEEVSQKITEVYKMVLQIDSLNFSANYNLGIHFYNQGVNIIENIDYNADIDVIMEKQIEVVQLFEIALPYMLKAYQLDPLRPDPIRGLSGIYYGLNDLEKSKFFQDKLDELEKPE